MNNNETHKDTAAQMPADKQPQRAEAAQNVTQSVVPYWWIMRRRNQ